MMINAIPKLVDSDEELLNEFLEMARKCQGINEERNLAYEIEIWFEHWLDDDFIEVKAITGDRSYNKSLQGIYRSLLKLSLQNISHEEWKVMARYYLAKVG